MNQIGMPMAVAIRLARILPSIHGYPNRPPAPHIHNPMNQRIDQIVEAAIEQRLFPGAVVLIADGPTILHLAAYGTTMYADPYSQAVTTETIYDIASLTKIFTATAALRLWEQGQIDLHASAALYLPELRATNVTVWHLLTHTSGLDLRLSVAARAGQKALMNAIHSAPIRQTPGSVAAYTNINSLLLGEIVARVAGSSLDTTIDQFVAKPLGLRETCFLPPIELQQRIAPTEYDHEWRQQLIHGTVHDESAHVLGGIAGHAGLFSTAADLHQFCLAWLEPTPTSRTALLRTETIALATRNHTPGLGIACGLGWMIDRPQVMGSAPTGTFGHTGFTGPAIIVGPQRQRIIIVLTNRVFPRRGPSTHHAIIAAIVDTALC
jgi:CubicO group peptidase (beta-lactamase class C family)